MSTLFRIEGFEASVNYRIGELQKLLSKYALEMAVIDADLSQKVWTEVTNVTAMADEPGDIWRVSCKPSMAADLVDRSQALGCCFDWAGGLIWIRTSPGTDLRERLSDFDGHATLIRSSIETRERFGMFHPADPGVARLTKGLRARFDPRGILNTDLTGRTDSEAA